VPDTVAAGRIAARLMQLLELPETGADGQPLSYGFRHESTGRQIGEQETLAQAGVNEHDTLRLVALTPAQAHASAPKLPPNETPAKPPAPASHQSPVQTTPLSPKTTVFSPPPPPPPPPSRQPAVAGGRWSSSMAIAVIVLAVVLAGVAVAIVVSRGGSSGAHALTHAALTDTVASSGSSATTGAGSGEQTTGETGEDTTTSTAGEGVLPAVSTQQMESEIQQMLRSWHEDVVQGDYRAAWNLLSGRKQAQEENEQGYATWAKNQSTLRPYLNPAGLQVSIQSTEPSSGVVQVDVTGMTWDKPGASCGGWSGITWVKYENGEWRYDPGYSTTPQREHEWKSRYSELLGGRC
jgi:hypothetical protein